jgi:hypothetical protein
MARSEDDAPRGKRALALSVLLHVCVAPAFVALLAGWSLALPDAVSVETSTAYATTIEHRAPRPAPVRAVARAPVPHPVVAQSLASLRPATVPHLRESTRRPAAGAPRPESVRPGTAAPAVQAVAVAQAGSVRRGAEPATAPPEQTPEPTPPPAPPAKAEAVAAGGWGQNFRDPAVMDDAALAALHSRYRGAVAHVDVDEDGRAVKVVVDGGGLDPDARADLERQLAALRYVPAECNGLRCAASFELRV